MEFTPELANTIIEIGGFAVIGVFVLGFINAVISSDK